MHISSLLLCGYKGIQGTTYVIQSLLVGFMSIILCWLFYTSWGPGQRFTQFLRQRVIFITDNFGELAETCSDIFRAAGIRGNVVCAATSTAYIPVCSFVEMIPNKRLQQLWINGSIWHHHTVLGRTVKTTIRAGCWPVHTSSQNLLMASGGNPLLRSPLRVNRRGSSQPLHNWWATISTFISTLPNQPDNSGGDESLYSPFWYNCVVEIESAKLPLDWTIDIQGIAQPVVGGASETRSTHMYMYSVM